MTDDDFARIIGDGTFDPACFCTTGGASTADVTLDGLLAAKAEMERLPRPDFDALVCLPKALAALKQEMPTQADHPEWRNLYGVPVYAAKDADDAALIVADLKGKGKRPAVVYAPGDPQEILDLPPLQQMPEPCRREAPPFLKFLW